MISFFIPGYYLLYSRLKRKSEVVSLLIIYPVFLFVMLFIFGKVDFIPLLGSFLLAWIAWLAAYEIGYLENDAITIKKEKNPTLRMKDHEILWVQHNFHKIQFIRAIIAASVLAVLFFNFKDQLNNIDFWIFAGCIVAARLFFYLHNTIRSRWNIATYILLSSTKYLSLPLLFAHSIPETPEFFVAILLAFPIVRTIEHAAKTKYNMKGIIELVGNIDFFRLKYYSAGFVLSILLYWVGGYEKALVFVITMGYFFVFRLLNVLIVSSGAYTRSKSRAHK